MAPPEDDRAGECLSREKSQGSQASDDGQQWEDFTRVGRWEELVGCVEDVLREWSCAEADEAPTNNCNTNISRARCLEHDGQLFSINLVTSAPPVELCLPPNPLPSATSSTPPPESSNATVSRACDLDNPIVDFAADSRVTPPQRWFGLRQYVLVRGLGRAGANGISDDQLLWAATLAAASCRCSIPVLVSCDWDGVEGAEGFGGERGIAGEGAGGGGASCKGFSAPGSKGTACSVRFQTAWTDQPPLKFLYLDGLTDLFLSKIKDAHCLPGRAFAPRVSTTAQQTWEWTESDPEIPTPAPGILWAGTFWSKRRSDLVPERAEVEEGRVEGVGGDKSGKATAVAAAPEQVDDLRREAMGRLLRAVGGGEETTPLWGPGEDQLEAICIRVRWEDLEAGLAEESEHYTTLEPLPEEGSGSVLGTSAGHWFVTARWKQQRVRLADGGNSSASGGRLGDACSRLLGALVLASAMHPGTLMADLGAAQGPESPTAMAEDYGKATADVLSADTRASIEKLCLNTGSPPITHDRIDLILQDLLRPRKRDAVAITVAKSEEEPTPGQGVETSTGDHVILASEPRLGWGSWRQSDAWSRPTGGEASVEAFGVETEKESGMEKVEKEGWWAGEGRGRAPVARLVSLLSLRVAECDDLRSMALLWMSFVRDVRLVWEDGATIERMGAVPEVDGTSMLDAFECGTQGGTGQNRSVAARLRGERAWPADPSGRGSRGRRRDRNDDESGSAVGSSSAEGEGDPVYPDTRMCLVWQKLQMLNCCRVEMEEETVASEAAAAGVDARKLGDVVNGEEGREEEGEDDGEVFYDTLEYCHQSDGEGDRRVGAGPMQYQESEQEPESDEDEYRDRDSIGDHDLDKEEGGGGGSSADREDPFHPERESSSASSHAAGASSDPDKEQATASTAEAAAAEAMEAPSGVAPVPAPDPAPSADRSTKLEVSEATAVGERVQKETAVVDEAGVDGTVVSDDRVSHSTTPPAEATALSASLSASVFEVDGAEGDRHLETTAAVPRPVSDGVDGDGSADNVGPRSEGFPQTAGVKGGENDDEAPLTVSAGLVAPAPPMATVASEKGEVEQDQEENTPSPYAVAAVEDRLGSGNEPRLLLRTGAAVRSPRLLPSGPVTGDMLEQQALGQARAYRERLVLRADMEAFLEENRGAVFADFVRWYRPEGWKDAAENGSGARGGMTAKDRTNSGISGGAEDDRRLAWPGQGQILWKNPDLAGDAPSAPPEENASELGTSSPPSTGSSTTAAAAATSTGLTLAGWLSCWGETRAAGEAEERGDRERLGGRSLFNAVKEGEKALHYLETISPGALLLQLLSALLGLSATLLEEAASSSTYGLPAALEVAASARRRVAEAVELLATVTAEVEGNSAATAGSLDYLGCGNVEGGSPSLPFPRALQAADIACLEVKRAETALARAVSLQMALPGQRDLANAIVACQAAEEGEEAPVEDRPQKDFLRDLLLAQGMAKATGVEPAELDLLTSSDEDQSKKDTNGGRLEGRANVEGTMPAPHTKEYVLRCQTPAPFYGRNLGRGQMTAYPTPPSRMYAKTDGRRLRIAVSICESDV